MNEVPFFASSKTVEHYTPRYIWERAIRCMGAIDVDPAADPGHAIPAAVHYTKEENGLKHEWTGRVWLNPPFGQDVIIWFEHLERDFSSGSITEAIVLWKAAVETEAFRNLAGITSLVSFPHARIEFIPGSGGQHRGKGSNFSPCLFYIGNNPESFIEAYSDISDIWKPVLLSAKQKQKGQTTIPAAAGSEVMA